MKQAPDEGPSKEPKKPEKVKPEEPSKTRYDRLMEEDSLEYVTGDDDGLGILRN